MKTTGDMDTDLQGCPGCGLKHFDQSHKIEWSVGETDAYNHCHFCAADRLPQRRDSGCHSVSGGLLKALFGEHGYHSKYA